MNIVKAHNLACPIDNEPLEIIDKQLKCSNGHAFDIARQGYINLLPVQHKRSKEPGDSKVMVLARTQFLNTGLYQPIAEKLVELSYPLLKDKTACLLDAGCGEGYYFDYILNSLTKKNDNTTLSFIGLDISKHAIHEAAKRTKLITWLVGTNRQPPVTNNSIDIITCVFGFQNFEGFTKILKPGGNIILVEPGAKHLQELREIIYTDVKKEEPTSLSKITQTAFSIIENTSLQFKTGNINSETINNLLLMTPHFFRATKAGREAASKLTVLDLTFDVIFRVLHKK